MAKYVFALRNVRAAHEVTAVGVKDAPRDMKSYYFTHDDTNNATAAEFKALIKGQLPSFPEATLSAMATALVAANANASARANETTGAGAWRYGKQILQGGVGYHASSGSAAIASVNWKNL
jgi:hypothetical protein